MSPVRVAVVLLLGSGLMLGDAGLVPEAWGQPPLPRQANPGPAVPAVTQQPAGSPAAGASDETTPKRGDAAEPAAPAAAQVPGTLDQPDREWPRKLHYSSNTVRLLRPAKGNFIAGFGEHAGGWTELSLHDGEDTVYAPTVGFEVACFLTNQRMIAFSGRTGTFDSLPLREDERVRPLVGYAVACFSSQERCVAFSAETGRFDSVELHGEAAAPIVGMRSCSITIGSMWYEFSARAGRWSGVDVGEPIGPQQVLPGHLGGLGGGFGGGGFGGGGGLFSVGLEGGSTAASNGPGGESNQTPIPFGGAGALDESFAEPAVASQPANPLNARRFEGGGGALGEGSTATGSAGGGFSEESTQPFPGTGTGALVEDFAEPEVALQPANPLNARRFEGGGGALGEGSAATGSAGGGELAEEAFEEVLPQTARGASTWKSGFANRLVSQGGMVFRMADGRRLACYSSRSGQWNQFELRDHEVVADFTVGATQVWIVTNQRLIGFSFEAGLFDAIDVPPEHAPIAPQNFIDYCWVAMGSRVATFSAKTGRWTVLELGEVPQVQPAGFLGVQ